MAGTLLEIKNFNAGYLFNKNRVDAVRNINLKVTDNEFLGIAGESGCGKSTLAFAITRLLQYPGKIFSGEVYFEGQNILKIPEREYRKIRWENFSIVFQASMDVLNPVKSVESHFADTFLAHRKMSKSQIREKSVYLMELVKVSPKYLSAFPFQLSGGMKQRIVMALALALKPKIIIMDEPTTALDVVVQRKIMQEISQLRREMGFSVIFITHDLSLLVEISDNLAIMYGGEIIEYSESKKMYGNPLHPYTYGLMNSFPSLTKKTRRLNGIAGSPPDLSKPVLHCPFLPRCGRVINGVCDKITAPKLHEADKNHFVSCYLHEKGVE